MGRDKALLPLGETTFLQHLATVLHGEVEPSMVVLGHHADHIEQQALLPATTWVLRNTDYSLGQLSSLQVALKSLDPEQVDALIVCLVDYPAITKQTLRSMRARFEQSRPLILIPTWRGKRGHPVVFSSSLFSELLDAPLDQGARSVVRRHSEQTETLEVQEEGILWDIDRPEDYALLIKRWNPTNAAASEPL
jgi:molybdenum cofactor cytidylyltransferase